jgi:hypothetical protein
MDTEPISLPPFLGGARSLRNEAEALGSVTGDQRRGLGAPSSHQVIDPSLKMESVRFYDAFRAIEDFNILTPVLPGEHVKDFSFHVCPHSKWVRESMVYERRHRLAITFIAVKVRGKQNHLLKRPGAALILDTAVPAPKE